LEAGGSVNYVSSEDLIEGDRLGLATQLRVLVNLGLSDGDNQKSRKPTKSFCGGPNGHTGRDEAGTGGNQEVTRGGPDLSRWRP